MPYDVSDLESIHWHNFTAFSNLPRDILGPPRRYCLAGILVELQYHETESDIQSRIVLQNSIGVRLRLDFHPNALARLPWYKFRLFENQVGDLTVALFSDQNGRLNPEESGDIQYRVPFMVTTIPKYKVTLQHLHAFELIDFWAEQFGAVQKVTFPFAEPYDDEDWCSLNRESCTK